MHGITDSGAQARDTGSRQKASESGMTERSVRPNSFWHPIRRRRFDSALVVLLALHLFPKLSALEQEQVENDLVEVFRARAADPYLAWRQMVGPTSDSVAILRGISMARLEMTTGIDGLAWNDVVPRSWLRSPLSALYSFRRFNAATDEAADFLRSNGIILDEASAHALRWMSEMHARYP